MANGKLLRKHTRTGSPESRPGRVRLVRKQALPLDLDELERELHAQQGRNPDGQV